MVSYGEGGTGCEPESLKVMAMKWPSLAGAVLKTGFEPAGNQSNPPLSAFAESIPPEAVTETPLRLASRISSRSSHGGVITLLAMCQASTKSSSVSKSGACVARAAALGSEISQSSLGRSGMAAAIQ
jgi:hypothetical protein